MASHGGWTKRLLWARSEMMQLSGIHHLTAVTAHASANHAFYTQTLGLRLVKKTVNQDDVSAYHLFFADGGGSPRPGITFFDLPPPPRPGGPANIRRKGLLLRKAEKVA